MLLELMLFSLLLADTSAQLSKSEQIGCLSKATNMAQAESDKELRKIMKKTLETITDLAMDITTELSEEQRDRIMNTYFTGKCTQMTMQNLFK